MSAPNTSAKTATRQTGKSKRFIDSSPLKRLWYFDGRFLDAADLLTEQTYLRNLVRISNRAIGHGVVEGLNVTTSENGLEVSRGLAVNADGEVIFLADEVSLEISSLLETAGSDSDAVGEKDAPVPNDGARARVFRPCRPDQGGYDDDVLGSSEYWVLSASPSSIVCGEEESFGPPCAPSCETRIDGSYVLEGVDFSLRPFDARPESTAHLGRERAAIATIWFAVERASRIRMSAQNLEACYWCEGAKAESGGSVDLAIFCLRGGRIRWLDMWTVRRELCEPSPKNHWFKAMDMRPWNVFLAQVLQFQCQVGQCAKGPQYDLPRIEAVAEEFLTSYNNASREEANYVVASFAQAVAPAFIAVPPSTRLWDCLGGDLPPCGWLPALESHNGCQSARAWFGDDQDITFRTVSEDAIGRAFHAAQHLDRISLEGDEPIQILVPVDRGGNELNWIFFHRRPQDEDHECDEVEIYAEPAPDVVADIWESDFVQDSPAPAESDSALPDVEPVEETHADLALVVINGASPRELRDRYRLTDGQLNEIINGRPFETLGQLNARYFKPQTINRLSRLFAAEPDDQE